MTFNPLKSGAFAALAICCIGGGALLLPASAMAKDSTATVVAADYQVKSSSNGIIKSGVKAFNNGDYAKAASLNKAVIRIRPSRMKTAIAQSNLCASLAKLGEIEDAAEACEAALKLRPELEIAKSNQALVKIRLAQK